MTVSRSLRSRRFARSAAPLDREPDAPRVPDDGRSRLPRDCVVPEDEPLATPAPEPLDEPDDEPPPGVVPDVVPEPPPDEPPVAPPEDPPPVAPPEPLGGVTPGTEGTSTGGTGRGGKGTCGTWTVGTGIGTWTVGTGTGTCTVGTGSWANAGAATPIAAALATSTPRILNSPQLIPPAGAYETKAVRKVGDAWPTRAMRRGPHGSSWGERQA